MPNPANAVPQGVCGLDPSSGVAYAQGLANYTTISTLGTTTVKGSPGLYYGYTLNGTGTAGLGVAAYDVNGTNTFTLSPTGTGTALGPQGYAGPPGMGVRFTGSLVVVTSGAAGNVNVLWD